MNIYVGNLSLEVTEEDLRREFGVFGEVASITIMNDRYIGSGQSRGYGYVEMPSQSEGQTAVAALDGKTFKRRQIKVVQALPLSDNSGGVSSGKSGRRYSRGIRQRSA